MAEVDFKNKEIISVMMQEAVMLLHDVSPEQCVFIMAAMPATVQEGDKPAFLITSNLEKSVDMLEVVSLLKDKLEHHIEKLRRMN